MTGLDDIDTATILVGDGDQLSLESASTLAAHPLDCIETPFPHVSWSVEGPDETVQPTEDHPVFYGCFDWHSAVHSHWSLVRQLRLFEAHPNETEIVESVERRLTADNVAEEVAYLESNPTFEKPYGWAWLLRLAAELHLWDAEQAAQWREVLRPLETKIVALIETEFLTDDRPFRVGTHHNSAFALQCVLDYARITTNHTLEAATVETADRFYIGDRDAPVAYEPLGWDFLSPSLTEADLMRRVLDGHEFETWLEAFLPDITTAPRASILDPIDVAADPDEDIALHLVGLNLSKAWCLAGLAETLAEHRYTDVFAEAARRHIDASLDQAFTQEYAGSHWLSTFVLYLATRNAGGIAPSRST